MHEYTIDKCKTEKEKHDNMHELLKTQNKRTWSIHGVIVREPGTPEILFCLQARSHHLTLQCIVKMETYKLGAMPTCTHAQSLKIMMVCFHPVQHSATQNTHLPLHRLLQI